MYSILSGEKVHSLEHSSGADIVGLVLSKDGSIVSCCSKGVVCYWDALNGKQIKVHSSSSFNHLCNWLSSTI